MALLRQNQMFLEILHPRLITRRLGTAGWRTPRIPDGHDALSHLATREGFQRLRLGTAGTRDVTSAC